MTKRGLKKLIFFVLLTAFFASVSGCGKKSPENLTPALSLEEREKISPLLTSEGEQATSSSEVAETPVQSQLTGETTTSTGEIKNSEILGIIEGSLSYPSEIIPELEICAENIKTQKKYCTKEQLHDEKYIYNRGYKIEVPVGEYSVSAEDNNSNKAFYSEFVVCGMKTECLSHKLIIVNVASGRTVVDINPFDWYKQ